MNLNKNLTKYSDVELTGAVIQTGDDQYELDLTIWHRLNPGEAFDVVSAENVPHPSNVLSFLRITSADDMERLGHALGMIKDIRAPSIYLHQGTWVGYDECGDEFCRNDSYWLVRRQYMLRGACLSAADSLPQTGDVWKHHNGIEYEVLLLTNQYSDRPEYPPTVSYQGANGKAWSKDLGNFLDSMTFVRHAEHVPCEALEAPNLGIVGVSRGNVWPANEAEDTSPQVDIDLQYSAVSRRCSGADNMWYGAILVNGQTEEHAKELRELVIEGLRAVCNPRDSLAFEGLLAKYHEAVWNDGQQGYAYDEAGEDEAKELIAMFRGEEKYTHHSEQQALVRIDDGCAHVTGAEGTFLLEKGEQVVMPAERSLHPLIKCLRDNGPEIIRRATEMQLETLKQAEPAVPAVLRNKVKCPTCHGEGTQWAAGCSAHPSNLHPCDTCKGEKKVDLEVALAELEDQPKTYGCHHNAETCMLCEGLVKSWKAKRAALVEEADPSGDHMFERFIRPAE